MAWPNIVSRTSPKDCSLPNRRVPNAARHSTISVPTRVDRTVSVDSNLPYRQALSTKRRTSFNNISAYSSRSHCFCRLALAVQTSIDSAMTDGDNDYAFMTNGFNTDNEVHKQHNCHLVDGRSCWKRTF